MGKHYGEGTLLQLGDGATPTEVFTTIAHRVSLTGPNRTVEIVDETDLDSEAVEKRPDLIPDPGDLEMELFFDPENAGHEEIEDFMDAPEVRNWRLVFNNGTNSRPHRQFAAFPTAFPLSGMEKGSDLKANVTLALTGRITKGTTTLS